VIVVLYIMSMYLLLLAHALLKLVFGHTKIKFSLLYVGLRKHEICRTDHLKN